MPSSPGQCWDVEAAPHSPLPHPLGVTPYRARIPHGSGDSDRDGSHPHRTHLGRIAGWGRDPEPALRDPPRQGPPRCRVLSRRSHPGGSVSFKSRAAGAEFSRRPPVPAGVRPGLGLGRSQIPLQRPPGGDNRAGGGQGHPGPRWHRLVLLPCVPAGSVPVEVKAHGARRWGQPEVSPQSLRTCHTE